MTSILDTIDIFLGDFATTISNRALDADPEIRERLSELDGNTIEFCITMPPTRWHLSIVDGRLVVAPPGAAAPQVIVRGDGLAILNWLINRTGVTIEGDTAVLAKLEALLSSYDPELDQGLAQVLGADGAHRLLSGVELGLSGMKTAFEGLGHALKGQSGEHFVQQGQFDDLLSGIDELRLRVDRLSANIKAADQKKAGNP